MRRPMYRNIYKRETIMFPLVDTHEDRPTTWLPAWFLLRLRYGSFMFVLAFLERRRRAMNGALYFNKGRLGSDASDRIDGSGSKIYSLGTTSKLEHTSYDQGIPGSVPNILGSR